MMSSSKKKILYRHATFLSLWSAVIGIARWWFVLSLLSLVRWIGEENIVRLGPGACQSTVSLQFISNPLTFWKSPSFGFIYHCYPSRFFLILPTPEGRTKPQPTKDDTTSRDFLCPLFLDERENHHHRFHRRPFSFYMTVSIFSLMTQK